MKALFFNVFQKAENKKKKTKLKKKRLKSSSQTFKALKNYENILNHHHLFLHAIHKKFQYWGLNDYFEQQSILGTTQKGLLFSILSKTIPHKSAVLPLGFGLIKGMVSINIASTNPSTYFSKNAPRCSQPWISSFRLFRENAYLSEFSFFLKFIICINSTDIDTLPTKLQACCKKTAHSFSTTDYAK